MNRESEIEVFNASLEIEDDAARERYLAEVCAGNLDLRIRLQELLDAHGRGVETFERLVPSVSKLKASTELSAGQRIGPYCIVEKIGEGGCGAVYVAEQHTPVRRRVALKVIKAGMDTRSLVARFEAERQALAMMDHPSIAKVFEAGATDQGRPYFAMELVQAEKITTYCDRKKLSVTARLELFVQVCQAVQHAHQKGVIHRDLKPSNILISDSDPNADPPLDPIPKIIDFGIAKAISGRLTDATCLTGFHQLLGTPAYMSPEQALITSEDIDTRSDIYSLGVLLYELLTGRPPFDTQELLTAGLEEMRRIIREVEPKRPSQVLIPTPDRHRNPDPLDPDLDWIVMKCLEKDRSRRYPTANGLAADIQRHLNNEPVVARPPTAAYRFKKYVQRNRIQFSSAVLLTLVLLGGVGVSTWQAVRAMRAEREAQGLVDFLIKQITAADLMRMEKPDPRSIFLLEKVAERLDTTFTARPLLEAEIRMTLGRVLRTAHFTNRLAHFKRAYELRREALGLFDTKTLHALTATACHYANLNRFEEAEELLRQVESLPITAPDSLGAAFVLGAQGHLLQRRGQQEKAIEPLHRAVAICREHPDLDDTDAHEFSLVWSLIDVRRFAEADQLLQEMLSRHEARAPESLMALTTWKAIAFLRLQQGQPDLALPILERISPQLHKGPGAGSLFALDADFLLGRAYQALNRTNDAVKVYTSLTPFWPDFSPFYQDRCAEIAGLLTAWGRFEDAEAAFGSLRKSFEITPPTKPGDFVDYLRAIAASRDWNSAIELCRTSEFDDSISVCLNKAWLSRFVNDESAYQDAVRNALRLASKLKPDDEHLPIEIAALGQANLSTEEKQQLTSLMAALEPRLTGRPLQSQVWAYRAIGHLQFQFGRCHEALESLRRSESLQSAPDAYTCFLRAACLVRLGNRAEAQSAFENGEKAMHPGGAAAMERVAHLLPPYDLFQKITMYREVGAMLNAESRAE